MKAFLLAALLVLAGISMQAYAQDQPPAAGAPAPAAAPNMAACKADIQSFCPNMTPGPQRHSCIVTNLSKMSPDCQAAVNAMQSTTGEVWKACGGDFKQYCKGATGPARKQCIAQNQAQFSQACQAELTQHPGMTKQ